MISLQSLRMRLGLLLVLAFAPIFGLTAYWAYLDQVSRLAALDASASRVAHQVATTYGQVIHRSREVLLTLSRLTEIGRRDRPGCAALLRKLLSAYPEYSSLDVARADGELLCSARPITRTIDVRKREAFRRALMSRAFAVGDFVVSGPTGRPMLTAAFPVLDGWGEVDVVIGAVMNVDWLNQLVAEFALHGAALVVVDRSGHVVVRQPDPERWVGRDVSRTSTFAARLRGETRFETIYVDGVKRRFVLTPVQGVPPPALLSVGVGIDQEGAQIAFRGALYRDLGVIFAVAFAAFAAAWFGTERSVTRRVNALLTATRRLAAGDLSARTGARNGGPSELRQLAGAFDNMATALEERDREMSAGRKAIAEHEALLHTVIEALPVGVWIIGTSGEILMVNRQAREIWGACSPEGTQGDDGEDSAWWKAAGERIVAHQQGIARALRDGEPSTNETIDIEGFDGTRKTVARWSVPLRDAEGRITGAVAVNQDITAGRQADAALHESEERYRNMTENLPMMFWITDASGVAVHINRKWYDYTGQAPAAALGFGWVDALHPDDAEVNKEVFFAANALTAPFCLEYRLRRHDGEYRHFIDSGSPRFGRAGEFLGYVGCVMDIHDRKVADERFRLAVEAAPSAMIIANERGVITMVNSQTERLFGYTRAELLGQPVEMLLPQRSRAQYVEDRADFFRTPGARVMGRGGDLFAVRKDGREVPVEIGLNPIRTEEGGFVLASITDMTERRRVEEIRARLETQMRQAHKMDALGTLAGGIAHDFNNILSAIMGNVDSAAEDVGREHPAQESLAVIREASDRARDLVQQILTFSRQQPAERHVVQLRDVAEQSVKLLRATLPAGIEIASAFAADTPRVLADRTHLHQVLMNLGTNAWQAIDGPVGRIEFALAGVVVDDASSHAPLRPGRYARLSVTDTGRGMDPAILERIFDPFFTTKALGEGTGLGLAVVDGVVKNHDGAIEVCSAPGQVTAFHLYFPATEVEAEAVRTIVSDLRAATASAFSTSTTRRRWSRWRSACSAASATRSRGSLGRSARGVRANPAGFDMCVTDLNMPAISGLEIAAELLRRRPDLPVAVASGNVTEALRNKAHALHVREVIYKPSTLGDLADALHRMVATRGSIDDAVAPTPAWTIGCQTGGRTRHEPGAERAPRAVHPPPAAAPAHDADRVRDGLAAAGRDGMPFQPR